LCCWGLHCRQNCIKLRNSVHSNFTGV
jgi:hypothetical protein